MTPSSNAVERLMSAYAERLSLIATQTRAGDCVGFIGGETPVEALLAAGLTPLRLPGLPGLADRPGDDLLSGDEMTRSKLSGVLLGRYGALNRLVVTQDSEPIMRLFFALRELKRIGEGHELPEVHFLDLSKLPGSAHLAYNRARLSQFIATLETWTGRTIEKKALALAIAQCNDHRVAMQGFQHLRVSGPARWSGTEALAIMGVESILPLPQVSALLREATDAPPSKTLPGPRLYLTGSTHDHARAYELIEQQGCVIVGEDHDWGAAHFEALVDQSIPDPIDALARRYQSAPPTAQRSPLTTRAALTVQRANAARADAVISLVWEEDVAPLWEYPVLRNTLAAAGTASLLVRDLPYRLDESERLLAPVRAFLASLKK